jgi:hypothetical protein
LHGGRVLPGLHKLVLQRLRSKHRVVEALKHVGLLAGPQVGTQRYKIDYSRVTATHLHPLLGLADRL